MSNGPNETAQAETPRVLLLERNRAVQATLRKYLEEGGYVVDLATDLDHLLELAAEKGPRLVLAGAEDPDRLGEDACARVKAEVGAALPVVIMYEPGADDAEKRASAAGADTYLVAPLKKHNVLAAVRDMLRIGELLAQIERLERQLEAAQSGEVAGAGRPAVSGETGYDFEFFKKLLLMEVKRSKRYAYPISLAIVGFDTFQEVTADLDAKERGRLVGSLLAQLTKSTRDIDLPVLYADDKVLVFMPHTPRAGALIVGGRLRDRVRDHAIDIGGDRRLRLTASVGVAAFEGQGTVSFGSLIKDALSAMRKVQLAGGDGCEAAASAHKSRVSIG